MGKLYSKATMLKLDTPFHGKQQNCSSGFFELIKGLTMRSAQDAMQMLQLLATGIGFSKFSPSPNLRWQTRQGLKFNMDPNVY